MSIDVIRDQLQNDHITELSSRAGVTWFVDANVVISKAADSRLPDAERVFTTPDVVAEVRKCPSNKRANAYIDRIEAGNGVVTASSYSDFPASFELLVNCAKRLSPIVELVKAGNMYLRGQDETKAEKKAVDTIGSKARFFKTFETSNTDNKALEEMTGKLDKASKRSWFSYPDKRRKRGSDYKYTDEKLIASALVHCILRQQPTCLLSDDTDCATIMKQLTDNLLWAITEIELKSQRLPIQPDQFIPWWVEWTRLVDVHRQNTMIQKLLNEINDSDPTSPTNYVFAPNEFLVCRVEKPVVSSYTFPDFISEFIRVYKGGVTWPGLPKSPSPANEIRA